MKIGLVIANHGDNAIDNVRSWPAEAEQLGFHSIWFTDHVIGLRSYAPRFSTVWSEALASLAHAAARTRTIRLGLGVMVLPYRNPVYAAKALATVDLLSEGRVDVGVGVGWSRSEYKALGVGDVFDDRGAYADEALDVMSKCWEGGTFGYSGRWTNFREIDFLPEPVQRPGLPIGVGGHSRPALRRAARFASFWHPMGLTPQELEASGKELDTLAGRPVTRTTRILVPASTDLAEIRATLTSFAAVGCEEVTVDLSTTDAAEFRGAAVRLAGLIPELTDAA